MRLWRDRSRWPRGHPPTIDVQPT